MLKVVAVCPACHQRLPRAWSIRSRPRRCPHCAHLIAPEPRADRIGNVVGGLLLVAGIAVGLARGFLASRWLFLTIWLPAFLLVSLFLWPYATPFVLCQTATSRHCPSCGYDLRATPDRCPECGRGRDEET